MSPLTHTPCECVCELNVAIIIIIFFFTEAKIISNNNNILKNPNQCWSLSKESICTGDQGGSLRNGIIFWSVE